MDGFDDRDEVIVMAATNRPDILDPAIQRPGRFDRKIVVGRPSKQGRVEIFKVHMKGKPISSDVDVNILAAKIPGGTGADIANIVNEAILKAVSDDAQVVNMHHFEKAINKVNTGDERPSNIMTEKEKRVVAYHETGHALTAFVLADAGDVREITVIPRSISLGHTQILPEDGVGEVLAFKKFFLARMVTALGGRAVEEIINPGNPSTGARNDIQNATAIAKDMVEEYAMSEDVTGYVSHGSSGGNVFSGRDSQTKGVSEKTLELTDEEIRRLTKSARDIAYKLIKENRPAVEAMVAKLLDVETIVGKDIDDIFSAEGAVKNYYTFTDKFELSQV